MPDPINRESDPRWETLGAYVRDIADRMGLTLWSILIETEPPSECGPPDDSEATIMATSNASYLTLSAALKFSDDFFDQPVDFQRIMVVHELVHLVTMPQRRAAESIEGSGCLGSREYSLWRMHWQYADENVTDTLARIIAPSMPLIDWNPDAATPPRV
ncbi:MAG: hypothetical protein ACYC6A_21590 [Armatimonadota bacterium]